MNDTVTVRKQKHAYDEDNKEEKSNLAESTVIVNVDKNNKTVEVLYNNKILRTDINLFIKRYLLSNIFKTNDKIINCICKNKPNLVNETKKLLSIIYVIDILDFNMIFEIPYDDFELNLSKCNKDDKIDDMYFKIAKLNNIISWNNLIQNRYQIKISKPFHNFTLKECIDYITQNNSDFVRQIKEFALATYNDSDTPENGVHFIIRAVNNNCDKNKSQTYRKGRPMVQKDPNDSYGSCFMQLVKERKDFKMHMVSLKHDNSREEFLFFAKQADHKYYLNDYGDRLTLEGEMYWHPSIYSMVEENIDNVLAMLTKNISIGKIEKKMQEKYQSHNYLEIQFEWHDSSLSKERKHCYCYLYYLPIIDGDIILLKFVNAIYYQSRSSKFVITSNLSLKDLADSGMRPARVTYTPLYIQFTHPPRSRKPRASIPMIFWKQ